jgi:hypothetical protein
MSRHSIVLIILIASSTSAYAQRGGRGDALQNYLGENRNPSLLLQLKYEKTRLYFSASELRKKPRSNIILTDPATGLTHLYEGVSVEQLVPSEQPEQEGRHRGNAGSWHSRSKEEAKAVHASPI